VFHRKYRTIFFAIVLGLFLSHIPVSTDSVNLSILNTNNSQLSSEVWSDDFENETLTLDQWMFGGINLTIFSANYTPNMALSNGMLYSDGPDINEFIHNSTITTGTWSLDVFFEDNDPYADILIVFMSPYFGNHLFFAEGYGVHLYVWESAFHCDLVQIVPEGLGKYIENIDEYQASSYPGWIHIDITRQLDSNMYVYLNGTLRLQGMDTHVNTSEYFVLVAPEYSIFDNVTVSDTVDIDKVSPHWTEPLSDQSINEGDDFLYSLHADDHAGLDTWWVTDSAHFAIDQEGNLTSVSPLAAGNYTVEVFVNDTIGNVLSGTFNLEVIELPATTISPTTTSTTTTNGTSLSLITDFGLVISVGSLGIIVVMIVLIARKK